MRKYWLLNQHDAEGPSALVETDGRMQVVRVLRFGPGITELDDQQKVWNQVIGRVAPTMKPCVDASSLDEEGVAPHADLWTGGNGAGGTRRTGRADASRSGGRAGGDPRKQGSRGDR